MADTHITYTHHTIIPYAFTPFTFNVLFYVRIKYYNNNYIIHRPIYAYKHTHVHTNIQLDIIMLYTSAGIMALI